MKLRKSILHAFVTCVVCVVAMCGIVLAQPQEAHAYTYIKTDSQSIYTKLWIRAQTNGSFELIGSDPCGWWDGAPSLYPGVVAKYEFATWSEPGGKNDIRWYNGTAHENWWRGGAHIGHGTVTHNPNGSGWGNVATYGYGAGPLYLSNHSGLDALMHTHVYQTDWAFPSTLYVAADWYPRVKIQYNANGGSGAPVSHYKYMGNLSNISKAKPRRTGYTFEGWSLTKKGTIQIAPGQRIGYMDWNYPWGLTLPGDAQGNWNPMGGVTPHTYGNTDPGIPSPTGTNVITLHAQWKPITYSITYKGNGATSGTTAPSSHVYDATRTLTTNGFKRAYTLTCDAQGGSSGKKKLPCTWKWKNWNVRAGGSGVSYPNKAKVRNLRTAPGALTLYAQWGSGSVVLPNPGTKKNCTFKGWFTAARGGSLVGQAGASISIAANTTYYAQWKTYATIGYYVDGERDPVFSEKVVVGSPCAANPQAADRGSKDDCAGFDGWYVDSACTRRYVDGSVLSDKGLKLYGRNKVDITYELTEQSHALLAGHELFADEVLDEPLSLEQALPQVESFYYGDRITFARGQSIWFEAHERPREASCEVGAYLSADATDAPVRTTRLISNTTAYLMWRVPAYDGIALS